MLALFDMLVFRTNAMCENLLKQNVLRLKYSSGVRPPSELCGFSEL
ncbi:hypothetical protein LEP1GSC067_0004 [Leptospira interrogans serovar Lora str. TE 1992]|uniref:Uncharacterized protein n=2 Tax=Leptospira interrogans TaxID=173 RepID=M3DLS2_LEPIR|nr:hypothetical protein G436_0848 [Leptospira interrogans serovar Hardjo str. Norma]EJP15568.1 hypothetical protein LEP1GSC080_3449 [Leptospira interrogans str. FPW2026]EKO97391.1 hypothetical protein LEP1GSC057_3922 [Leptospira interrogans str. Brem 329]EMF42143.1 hypothetical protein LEP1GSC067_0004 [Leptospira interrogans serovar Lora str. TE 1992]EMN08407.1 hypothetical protein LEP1GSC053_2902 [Leptospira interrogans serovar Muenchen str. Brem 129]